MHGRSHMPAGDGYGLGRAVARGLEKCYSLHVHVTETVKDVPNEAKAPRPG